MATELSNDNSIEMYLHCKLCLDEKVPQQISVGWTELGLQVWCDNHDCNMVHIDFEGNQHPANTNRKPAKDGPKLKVIKNDADQNTT